MKPKVSVVVPVYNAETFIDQCLESILSQTLKEIEVVCVNDGSTDTTLEKLRKYEKKDCRVRVINQKNINAGAARNNGFKFISGEYVTFLDADDFFESDMLKKMFERAKKVSADIVVVDSDMYLNDRGVYAEGFAFRREMLPKKEAFSGMEVEKVFSAFVGWPWDKMFSVKFLKNNKLYFQEQRSTNDLYFVYAALIRAKKISVIYDILAHHRVNVKTSISMTREKSWDCSHTALMKLKEQLLDWQLFDADMERAFSNYALNHSIWQLSSLSYPAQKKFYNTFKNNWANEYGLTDRSLEFFYDSNELRYFERVLNSNYEEFLIGEKNDISKRVNELEVEVRELDNTIKDKNREIANYKKGVEDIKKSRAYKVGMALTSLPRKVKSIIKGN